MQKPVEEKRREGVGEHDAHPPLFPSFAHKSGVRASNGERERERGRMEGRKRESERRFGTCKHRRTHTRAKGS